MIHRRIYFQSSQCSFQFSVHSKSSPLTLANIGSSRLKAHACRVLAELSSTTPQMGDIKQAELWLKYIFFSCPCSTLRSFATTLQLKRQQPTHVCLQKPCQANSEPTLSWKPDVFCQFSSAYEKLWVPEKKTPCLEKRTVYFWCT